MATIVGEAGVVVTPELNKAALAKMNAQISSALSKTPPAVIHPVLPKGKFLPQKEIDAVNKQLSYAFRKAGETGGSLFADGIFNGIRRGEHTVAVGTKNIADRLRAMNKVFRDAGFQGYLMGQALTRAFTLPIGAAVGFGNAFGISVAAKLESAEVALKAMLPPGYDVEDLLQRLQKLAIESPVFNTQQVVQFTKQLVGAGVEGKRAVEVVQALGKVYLAYGLTAEDAEKATRGVYQAFAKGRLYAEELNQQISENLPATYLFATAAQNLGLITEKAAKKAGSLQGAFIGMVKDGQITSSVLDDIIIEVGKLPAISRGSAAAVSTMQFAFDRLKDSMSNAFANAFLKFSPKIQEGLNRLTNNAKDFAEAIASTAPAVINFLNSVIEKLVAVVDKYNSLSPGQKTFIKNMLLTLAVLGPFLFIVGRIATVLGGLALYASNATKSVGYLSNTFLALKSAEFAATGGGTVLASLLKSAFGGITVVLAPLIALMFRFNGVITTIAFAFGLWRLSKTIGETRVFTQLMMTLGSEMAIFGANVRTSGVALGTFNYSVGAAKAGMNALLASISPVGLALGALVVGFGIFAQKAAEQKSRIDSLKQSLQQYMEIAKKGGPDANEQLIQLVGSNKELADAVNAMSAAGIQSDQIQEILTTGNMKLLQSYLLLDPTTKRFVGTTQEQTNALQDFAGAQPEALKAFQAQQKATKTLSSAQKQNADITSQAAEMQKQLQEATQLATGSKKESLHDTIQATIAEKGYAAAIEAVNEQLDLLRSKEQTNIQTTDDFNKARIQFLKTIGDGTRSLIVNKKASLDNQKAVLDNRDALIEAIKKSRDMAIQEIQTGGKVSEATKKHQDRVKALLKEVGQSKANRAEAGKLVKAYGEIPKKIATQLTMSGTGKVFNTLESMLAAQQALKKGISLGEAKRALAKQSLHAATGGLAGELAGLIRGPGGPTGDKVGPFMLSSGEFVVRSKAVNQYGRHVLEAINRGLIPADDMKALMRRRFFTDKPGDLSEGFAVKLARGGFIQKGLSMVHMLVNLAKTKIPPQPAEIRRGLNAQSWIRSQSGKPYMFGAAGPNAYDCSGMVGAVYNLLKGRNPYRRIFTTDTMQRFFKPGRGGIFNVGYARGGERGGGSIGHTAGLLGGLKFESRGGAGVVVGQGATDISSFARHGHYDRGGWLPPGLTSVWNGTGKPEMVLTDDQMNALGGTHVVEVYLDGQLIDAKIAHRIERNDRDLVHALKRGTRRI